jgi:endonuclease/exonuclease/phosphatase family metal-dependent hydrolase
VIIPKLSNAISNAINEINEEINGPIDNYVPLPPLHLKKSFNRFHSPLRYFNPDGITNSFKSAILGPMLNYIGTVLNFVKDKDSEILAELASTKFSHMIAQGKTWLALGKALISLPGAVIRLSSTIVDFAMDIVFSPFRTVKNLWAAINDPMNCIKQLTRHYQLIEPSTHPLSIDDANAELKVMTLNAALLREVYWDVAGTNHTAYGKKFVLLNTLRRPRERAEKLADFIIQQTKEKQLDVICLQEVFDDLAYLGFSKDGQRIIIDKLKSAFPYIVHDIGYRRWPCISSGLMVLSNKPIIDVEFHRYPNTAGLEYFANKGFVAVKLKQGNDITTVYTTHNQADRGSFPPAFFDLIARGVASKPGEMRNEQLGYINEHMNHCCVEGSTIIMTGDLNEGLGTKNELIGRSSGEDVMEASVIKYPHKAELLSKVRYHTPGNYVDCSILEPIFTMKEDGVSFEVQFLDVMGRQIPHKTFNEQDKIRIERVAGRELGIDQYFIKQGQGDAQVKIETQRPKKLSVDARGRVVEELMIIKPGLKAEDVPEIIISKQRKGEHLIKKGQFKELFKLHLAALKAAFPDERDMQLIDKTFHAFSSSIIPETTLDDVLNDPMASDRLSDPEFNGNVTKLIDIIASTTGNVVGATLVKAIAAGGEALTDHMAIIATVPTNNKSEEVCYSAQQVFPRSVAASMRNVSYQERDLHDYPRDEESKGAERWVGRVTRQSEARLDCESGYNL